MSTKTAKTTITPSSGFTKEEQLLLNDFSRNVSTKSSALFYGNAFIVSALPICKYFQSDAVQDASSHTLRHVNKMNVT